MVRQGWLTRVPTARGPGYRLTDRAALRLDEAATRIYRRRPSDDWDGRWSVALVPRVADRTRRERLHRALEYLGYRQLHPGAWVAPRPAPELASVLRGEGVETVEFAGAYLGDDTTLVERLYAPADLAAAYDAWLAEAQRIVADGGVDPPEDVAFAVRSTLVHEWRKFLFRDPGLPLALLPDPWPGTAAAAFFDTHATRLLPAARRFVDCCLSGRDS
jgi:phenylacetic acid degradation operon negative regulatory protein